MYVRYWHVDASRVDTLATRPDTNESRTVPRSSEPRGAGFGYRHLRAEGPSGLDFQSNSRLPIERITVDDQGRPWVRRTNAQGVIAFDIYSSGQPVATAGWAHIAVQLTSFVVRGDDVYMVAR
jgi:hypothetical protein